MTSPYSPQNPFAQSSTSTAYSASNPFVARVSDSTEEPTVGQLAGRAVKAAGQTLLGGLAGTIQTAFKGAGGFLSGNPALVQQAAEETARGTIQPVTSAVSIARNPSDATPEEIVSTVIGLGLLVGSPFAKGIVRAPAKPVVVPEGAAVPGRMPSTDVPLPNLEAPAYTRAGPALSEVEVRNAAARQSAVEAGNRLFNERFAERAIAQDVPLVERLRGELVNADRIQRSAQDAIDVQRVASGEDVGAQARMLESLIESERGGVPLGPAMRGVIPPELAGDRKSVV